MTTPRVPRSRPEIHPGPAFDERRPRPEDTFDLAWKLPGCWVQDSSSTDEDSARNRASYLRRRAPKRAKRGGVSLRARVVCTRRGDYFDVLVTFVERKAKP